MTNDEWLDIGYSRRLEQLPWQFGLKWGTGSPRGTVGPAYYFDPVRNFS
ncbi:MAG TPA: hypothetical protein VN794_09645 [Methylomirabilota bacterium]|jgi:hypothetical protein|nr:hypothetical protein [Methylomirabilota bacterium]